MKQPMDGFFSQSKRVARKRNIYEGAKINEEKVALEVEILAVKEEKEIIKRNFKLRSEFNNLRSEIKTAIDLCEDEELKIPKIKKTVYNPILEEAIKESCDSVYVDHPVFISAYHKGELIYQSTQCSSVLFKKIFTEISETMKTKNELLFIWENGEIISKLITPNILGIGERMEISVYIKNEWEELERLKHLKSVNVKDILTQSHNIVAITPMTLFLKTSQGKTFNLSFDDKQIGKDIFDALRKVFNEPHFRILFDGEDIDKHALIFDTFEDQDILEIII